MLKRAMIISNHIHIIIFRSTKFTKFTIPKRRLTSEIFTQTRWGNFNLGALTSCSALINVQAIQYPGCSSNSHTLPRGEPILYSYSTVLRSSNVQQEYLYSTIGFYSLDLLYSQNATLCLLVACSGILLYHSATTSTLFFKPVFDRY